MACLSPGQGCSIEIYVQSGQIGPTAALVRDKFLITAIAVEDGNMSNQKIGELMKVWSCTVEKILSVGYFFLFFFFFSPGSQMLRIDCAVSWPPRWTPCRRSWSRTTSPET